ncbi:hypothetical protein BLOT_009487 [Blomia tropicalis]|nr:hypothetical protein BLOT_009487 [Blomia tropicalis]
MLSFSASLFYCHVGISNSIFFSLHYNKSSIASSSPLIHVSSFVNLAKICKNKPIIITTITTSNNDENIFHYAYFSYQIELLNYCLLAFQSIDRCSSENRSLGTIYSDLGFSEPEEEVEEVVPHFPGGCLKFNEI